MAEKISKTYKLLTVRIRLIPKREEAVVAFDTFHGREPLEQFTISAKEIGIEPELTIRAYQNSSSCSFSIPEWLRQSISVSLLERRESSDEPIWLQVDQSSGYLAVVPWEGVLHLHALVLRIPNFLSDPVFPSHSVRLALCASSPRTQESFSVSMLIDHLIRRIEYIAQLGEEFQIHIFSDHEVFRMVETFSERNVIVHNPEAAEVFGMGESDRKESKSSKGRLSSPWLLWMQEVLSKEEQRIDGVHFICPGYFSGEHGSLALARSPMWNEDTSWAHFVGANELIGFLDLLGTWSVSFFSPYFDKNVWSIGLRLLTDRLAWRWPGTIVSGGFSDYDYFDFEDFERFYRFLYGTQHDLGFYKRFNGFRDFFNTIYCHPKRLKYYAVSDAYFETPENRGIPEKIKTMEEDPRISKLARKPSEEQQWEKTQPQWKAAIQQQLDRKMLTLGNYDRETREGVLDALEFMSHLIDEREI